MSSPLLIEMQQRLSAGLHRRSENRAYWENRQPMAYLAPESRAALGNRFGALSVNFARVSITALTERLRLNGIGGEQVWPDLLALDYDQLADTLHREALLQGEAFALVWADKQGNPTLTIESGDTVAVKRDDVTRQIVAGIKQVTTKTTPATPGHTDVWLYQSSTVEHWRSTAGNAQGGFELIETTPNPLGVVPIVAFTNADLLPSTWAGNGYLEYSGESELEPLKCLIDGLAKTIADLAVAQEFTARPRRWATGIELSEDPVLDADGNEQTGPDGEVITEEVNPIPEGNRAMVSENNDAAFGQLPGADLRGFRTSVDIWIQAIMTVSCVPPHMAGVVTANPSTSEAMQAAEAGLTAKAESKAKLFGKSHEQVARLVWAIRHKVDVRSIQVRATWGPFDQRSESASAVAASQLFGAGLLSRRAVLQRLGYSEDQIREEINNVNRDAQDENDIRMGRSFREMGMGGENTDLLGRPQ